MSDAGAAMKFIQPKTALRVLIGTGLLLVLIANSHLVYVAIISQPECVAHLRQGESTTKPGQFKAASSSCIPQGGPQ